MEKVRAERVVKRVKGVRGLAEELEVRYTRDDGISDEEIARRALSVIGWDPSVPADKIQVRVENGWITISGKVDWYFQKVSAQSAVRRLFGVKGVSNRLAIGPHVQPKNVKSRIEKALKRKAGVEASKIKITVSGSKVILDGNVNAWFERNAAEDVAWAVLGVTAVEDRLDIS